MVSDINPWHEFENDRFKFTATYSGDLLVEQGSSVIIYQMYSDRAKGYFIQSLHFNPE